MRRRSQRLGIDRVGSPGLGAIRASHGRCQGTGVSRLVCDIESSPARILHKVGAAFVNTLSKCSVHRAGRALEFFEQGSFHRPEPQVIGNRPPVCARSRMSPSENQVPRVRQWHGVDRETFLDEIVPAGQPAVLRGLVAHWPAVRAANESREALSHYLMPGFGLREPVSARAAGTRRPDVLWLHTRRLQLRACAAHDLAGARAAGPLLLLRFAAVGHDGNGRASRIACPASPRRIACRCSATTCARTSGWATPS
jgi:hypothetical protein